jgi:hypothetical protein
VEKALQALQTDVAQPTVFATPSLTEAERGGEGQARP